MNHDGPDASAPENFSRNPLRKSPPDPPPKPARAIPPPAPRFRTPLRSPFPEDYADCGQMDDVAVADKLGTPARGLLITKPWLMSNYDAIARRTRRRA